MSKSEVVRARIEPELKARAEAVFRKLGLNTTQAITLFYKQVELHNGIPFELSIPNKVTAKTIEDAEAGKGLTRHKNLDDMFNSLD
ncbi:MAG: type II toxin-antitoxin system RelB/DinJ family antitoxin [Candidatus Thiodiazotropha taylori]|nr:type II toxin-antitoxin system RelB/DinJ family antitoxin [Candidatus Thiodiazotropha taylori]MCW4306557.1 type II toxin-antitoxin system RelB/DinJ family antitoxin [Candidatus Thiodiazotropha taylori]